MENERLLLQEQNDKLLEEEKEKLKLGLKMRELRKVRDDFLSLIYI